MQPLQPIAVRGEQLLIEAKALSYRLTEKQRRAEQTDGVRQGEAHEADSGIGLCHRADESRARAAPRHLVHRRMFAVLNRKTLCATVRPLWSLQTDHRCQCIANFLSSRPAG